MLDLFTFTARDRWGRPVRRLDLTALTIAVAASAGGSFLLVRADWLFGGIKLAHRLATSF